jgi:hypothetical protein
MIAMISDRRPKYRARRSAQPHFDRSTGRLIAAHLDDGRNDNSNPAPIKPVRNGIAANSFIAIMAHLKFLNVLTSLRGLAEVMSLYSTSAKNFGSIYYYAYFGRLLFRNARSS